MIVSFSYKPFMGVVSHYKGKLLNPQFGSKITFQVQLPKGVADFRLSRVVPEDKAYMLDCVREERAYLDCLARIAYRKIVFKGSL